MKIKIDRHDEYMRHQLAIINSENEQRREAFKHLIHSEHRQKYDNALFVRRFEREKKYP